ncbi:Tm-1-like ATP-binding domain-containing protein [Microlunatus soli]|uniref:Uncharacterized protein, UPF0261 family n=1 Tax=Microlunatus soli TaxID=630515 RepID=A0A1H1PT38_9ACTN|nr:Tm-1-like ATP-binding domain-containing protein [Microlunatus soli]SDS14330.1 Uncharacterized protein, UPF0261 family [Microlunatus soli]
MEAARSDSTVVLLGTMDTKAAEYGFVRDRLRSNGLSTVVIDTGVLGEPGIEVDITREQVAIAAGTTLAELVADHDRGRAVARMAEGAAEVIMELLRAGRFAGALALGGTGGTSIAARALQPIPIGVPKIIVSTVAVGNTTPYVGNSDLVLFPSVVDIAGLNRVSSLILANAADALTGMMQAAPATGTGAPGNAGSGNAGTGNRQAIAASMFGVTTPCLDQARRLLDDAGYEVLVFHMTGIGGRTMERLIDEGMIGGVLDATTTELADELVGGVFSAGPERLTAAARARIPQVVSVGALDMVNFGAMDTVPAQFADRRLLVHNPTVTLMRTTPEECAELGRRLAERVSSTSAPATVVLPLRGISAVSVEGGPFHDPEADRALFDSIRTGLDRDRVDLVEVDTDINDPTVARLMTDILSGYLPPQHRSTTDQQTTIHSER